MKQKMFLEVKLCLLLVAHLAIAEGAFIEMPTSQTVSVGEVAEFRCSHSTADTIRWRVNGTLVSLRSLPPDVALSIDSELVNILTIIGRPEYNGTEVVGVARFDDGSPDETTNPAAMLDVSMNTTEENMAVFIEVPQSVTVNSGGQAQFRCEHPSAEGYIWLVNGTALRNLPQNVLMNFIEENGVLLSVQALSEYNLTSVQCVATFTDRPPVQSFTATLTVQGRIDNVKGLKKQNSTLSWNPPFSLDLTNVEPDIAYCVDVYNITCGGRELLISDCDVTETSYTSDVIAPDGYIYEYIVTPRSNVEGAVNGTPSQPLRGYLPVFNGSSNRLSVGNFGQDSSVRAYQTELKYTSNDPIPSSYSLSLQSLDGLEDMDHVETTATIEPSVLTLEVVSGLPFRRLWNCTVLAYGCRENNILNDELSTHDFRDIWFSSLHPGEVRLAGSFTDDSTATGVLVIVIGDSEVIYHKASRDGTDKIKETLITGLAGGEYRISVFVVEENGLPFERVATSPKLVAVETNDVVTPPSPSIEYSLQSNSTGVCITCTFLDSSATDCVAVVHHRISQLSSSGLMNIESSHKLTRSGNTASGCIEGVNMEDYQVGVFEERQDISASVESSCVVCVSVGSVTVVLLLLVLVVLVLIGFVCKRSQQKRMWHPRVHIRNRSTTNNNDTESGHGNEYEKSPLDKKEEVAVEMDTESTPPPLYSEVASPKVESAVGHVIHHVPHRVPQRAHRVDQGQPVYVETFTTQVNDVPAPRVVDRQEYDQVTGFKNPEGLHYAIIGRKDKPQKTPLDNDARERVVYSELMPQVSQDVVVDDSNEKDNHPQLDSVQPEVTEHLGTKVIVHNSVCQPEVKSSQAFLAYRTEDNVNRIANDSNCDLQTSDRCTSLAGFMSKSADPGYGSGKSSEESVGDSDPIRNSPLAHDQPPCSVADSPPNKCHQIFFSQYGTEEPNQMNTQSVQRPHMCTDEHDDNPYMTVVTSTLSVSHHLQMPKEEQQRLSHCKPVAQECLWQTKASVLAQDYDEGCGLWQCQTVSVVNFVGGLQKSLPILRGESVVNRAHNLLEWLSGVHTSPISIFNSACIGQWWLPSYQASVFKFASNLPVKLSRLMMIIYVVSLKMSQAVENLTCTCM